jgi:hypothetical protein
VLQTITAVPGVVHVRDLALRAGDQDAECENVCVPATWLVAPGVHTIEMG